MSLVNVETGELIEGFDSGAAERRAMKISLRLDSIAENFEAVMPMIREAIAARDDLALGYRSPGDYVRDRFGQALSRLPVELRRETVRELTEAGLSTRAIAPVVGVSNFTIHSDQKATAVRDLTPETPEPADVGEADVWRCPKCNGVDTDEHADPEDCHCGCGPETGCLVEGPPPATRPPVTGIDGKTYPRPEPKAAPKARRKPLLDDLAGVVHDLSTSSQRLAALLADERYPANADQVAAENRDDLIRISGALQGAVTHMS